MGAGVSVTSISQSGPDNAGAAAPATTCPVDHKTREIWLAQHRDKYLTTGKASMDQSGEDAELHAAAGKGEDQEPALKTRPLSTDREISSIPRALSHATRLNGDCPNSDSACPVSHTASHASPSNSESETGQDENTGNWVYPSEKQFFEAVIRKSTPMSATSPRDLATSIASIIPIHNAVNERAWSEIKEWESRGPLSDPGSKKCGGPKLYSFRGVGVESQFLSPRARFNSLLGYQLPFDRHDWTVERCDGERVDYVIDFYQGRSRGDTGGDRLNFYLDVRPKLNTWEGCRMRAMKFLGLS
ncbi:hypothetical protein KEM54_004312 [Ascosphaera aggregata]|nr:hypothetical protein KEM54_004312 [Ascosphaera aggregata]